MSTCCAIDPGDPQSLQDQIQLSVATATGLAPSAVFPDFATEADTENAYAVVLDLGEQHSFETSEWRMSTRRFRVRYYNCDKAAVEGGQRAIRQLSNGPDFVTQDGWACWLGSIKGQMRIVQNVWIAEITLSLREAFAFA